MTEADQGAPAPLPPQEPFGRPRAVLLTGIVLTGSVLLYTQPLYGPSGVWRLGGASLLVYAAFVLLAWFPLPWLSRRIEQRFEGWVGHGHAGWYLIVAVAYFALAETVDVLNALRAIGGLEDLAANAFWRWLVGFSVESILNMVWASLWPLMTLKDFGLRATALMAGSAYAVWWLGRRIYGEVAVDGWR